VPARACAHQLTRVRTRARARRVRIGVADQVKKNSGHRARAMPGGFYDVRWFRADDRGKLVEITRERFQLRNHSIGPRRGSISRTNPRLAPKALPISEDDIKPRRLAPESAAQRGRDQATESCRGPLARRRVVGGA
jgi:hypothetical protein